MASFKIKYFKQSARLLTLVFLVSCNTSNKFDCVAHINNKMIQLEFNDNSMRINNGEQDKG